ncbi:MAG: DNA/RNA non-specific endonuclease [Pseudonocardiales bacterium]
MINPAGIPRIPGNMEILAQHAGDLGRVGPEFSGTGQRVNSTWQQLAGVYHAPEAGQLLAATGPVQTTTASVGEDIATVAGALATYAATVKEIQNQLDALRTQAQTLVNEAKADKDSEGNLEKIGEFVGIGGDDDEYAERSNELMDKVHTQVAAFAEAQRVCANTINALYGGIQYRADDGNADQEPGEYGFTTEQLNSAFEQGQQLPWGSYAETDTGIVGGVWDGMKNFAGDLGALIGRDPVTGDWSWGTAGTAWKGLGTFVLAVGVYITMPGGALVDQAVNNGALGNTLVNAGKGLIAYDEWGKGDNARAGGMAGFNVLSAIVGTKGAGATLRGVGGGAQTSRIGAISRAGTAMVRSGEFIGRLPTTESLITRVSQHLPQLKLPDGIPDINLPHHTDTPHIDTPRVDGPRIHTPNPGSVGDNLADTSRPHTDTPSTPNIPHAPSAPDVPGPRSGGYPPTDAPTTPNAPSTSDAPRSPDTPSSPDSTVPDTSPDGSPSDGPAPTPDERPLPSGVERPHVDQTVHVPESQQPGPRTPFSSRTDLAPNTEYVVDGRGRFFTNEHGVITHVEAPSGTKGAWNPELERPLPNATYVVDNRYVYETDALGRTEHMHTDDLGYDDRVDTDDRRNRSGQSEVGNRGGGGYEGGHLAGTKFLGPGERINLVPMLREINRGAGDTFSALEREWRNILARDPTAQIAIDVRPQFRGDSQVPSRIVVNWKFDGVQQRRRIFENVS